MPEALLDRATALHPLDGLAAGGSTSSFVARTRSTVLHESKLGATKEAAPDLVSGVSRFNCPRQESRTVPPGITQ